MGDNATCAASGLDYWSARGFDLKSLIAQVYDLDVSRVDFPDVDATRRRYDVAVVLPRKENEAEMKRLVQEAFQAQFKLSITPESRPMDVYVMTAPNGPGPALHQNDDLGGFTGSECRIEWNSPDGQPPTFQDIQKAKDQMRASSKASLSAG